MNVAFAAFIVFATTGRWDWLAALLLAVNVTVAIWACRRAMQVIKVSPDGIKIINVFMTRSVTWPDIKRFFVRPGGGKSNLAGEPFMELKDGTSVRLSPLVPWYSAKLGDLDVARAISRLNALLDQPPSSDRWDASIDL